VTPRPSDVITDGAERVPPLTRQIKFPFGYISLDSCDRLIYVPVQEHCDWIAGMAVEMCEIGNIVESVADIGSQIRQERKRRGMTQADFAMSVGVGRRFIIDLERGKETIEAGKMLTVLVQAGFIVRVDGE